MMKIWSGIHAEIAVDKLISAAFRKIIVISLGELRGMRSNTHDGELILFDIKPRKGVNRL